MAKQKCKVCGNPAESDYCFRHKPRKPLKRSRLVSKGKKKSLEDKDRMYDLFLEIWEERGPYSELDNTYLGEEPLSTYFDHLLEKNLYPHLQYEKENILIVSFEQHQLKTDGHPLPKHQEAIDKAKQIFGII